MRKEISFGKLFFLIFLSILLFDLPAKGLEYETDVTFWNGKSNEFILAQKASGFGEFLQPPVISIEACMYLENIEPNSPGNPRCIARGGGRNGFWRYQPWILVHFRGLAPGEHKLYKYFGGETREKKFKTFKIEKQGFVNYNTGYWVWFQSPIMVGEHCLPCVLDLFLDGDEKFVGRIIYSGSWD